MTVNFPYNALGRGCYQGQKTVNQASNGGKLLSLY